LGLINAHYIPIINTVHGMCTIHDEFVYWHDNIWPWIDLLLTSAVPCTSLIVLNTSIIVAIKRAARAQRRMLHGQRRLSKSKAVASPHSNATPSLDKNRKHLNQLTIMLVTVSVTMVILTTPNSIFFVSRHYWESGSSLTSEVAYHVFYHLSVILVSVNNAVNFFLYFISGQKFRKQCIETICFCRRVKYLNNTSRTNNVGTRKNINLSEHSNDNIGSRNNRDINLSERQEDNIGNHNDINLSDLNVHSGEHNITSNHGHTNMSDIGPCAPASQISSIANQ
jgi:hypothetical protein